MLVQVHTLERERFLQIVATGAGWWPPPPFHSSTSGQIFSALFTSSTCRHSGERPFSRADDDFVTQALTAGHVSIPYTFLFINVCKVMHLSFSAILLQEHKSNTRLLDNNHVKMRCSPLGKLCKSISWACVWRQRVFNSVGRIISVWMDEMKERVSFH